jgi:hypothetical protein
VNAAVSDIDVQSAAAQVLEQFVTGHFKRAERAAGHAESLRHGGHLLGGPPRPDVQARVAAELHCVMEWPTAERAAAALAAAGLLPTLPANPAGADQ